VVYSNNFECGTAGFNLAALTILPVTDVPAGPGSTFLGRFSNDFATLTLSGLTPGVPLELAFVMFVGATWDGDSATFGPDSHRLLGDGVALLNAMLLNIFPGEENLSEYTQCYSDATPTGPGSFAPFTGADVAFMSGGIVDRDAICYFGHGAGDPVLTFTPTASTATLVFSGVGLQQTFDEFWVIDNVVVTAIPEPASAGLLLAGAPLLAP